jgi:predicted enzyme related to lactoylglutathione lyase
VLKEPADIPGVGRFALIQDPQGAMFYIIRMEMPAASS